MRKHPVVVTEFDARRLRSLLGARNDPSRRDQEHLQELRSELEQALVLDEASVPHDVITMHARVQVLDLGSGERTEYVLVFPNDADPSARRISVLAPLGTALLGYRQGDEVEWEMPGGLRRLLIERVSQPILENPTEAPGTPALSPASATAH